MELLKMEKESPGGKRSRPLLLFALSVKDKESFLRGQDLQSGFDADSQWIDVSRIKADEWCKLLLELDPDILVTAWDTPPLPEAFLAKEGMRLRYVCHITGGVRSLLPRTLLERGVLVSNWGTTVSRTVAEHALLLALGALRNLPRWDSMKSMPAKRTAQLRTCSLYGRRVGLHGFGGIAREIVKLLAPFGVRLSAYSFGAPRQLFDDHGAHFCDSLAQLFSTSEVLIECESLTAHSRGSVDREILSLLPEDAVFVNVGRGQVVDETALVAMAKEGRVRVALDVFAQEPLPVESPLYDIPNALLSPHIAGPTWDAMPRCGDFCLANLRRYLRGEPLEGVITLEVYDRST